MQRFKNILYFADGTKQPCHALRRAVALAETNNARLTVIDVIEEYPPDRELEKRLGVKIERLLQDTRLAELEELIEPFQKPDQLIYIRVLTGIPFVEVIRAVMQNKHDLVIKASRPPDGMAERILGSTDLHLLRKCPCPVWIDRPDQPRPYQRILAAVDPGRAIGQARLVLDLATSLARSEKATVEVLHAWRLEGESLLRSGRAGISRQEVDQLVAREREKHRAALDQLLEPYGWASEQPNVHLVNGPATPSILSAATNVDLIVMGTIGRTGMPGLFIGNTAENVMQNARASILAVKPDGFVSPLADA